MDRLIQVVVNTLALYVATLLVPGISFVGEWWKLLLVALAFSLLNTYLRPLLRILTLPITMLTFGLFLIVINALMLLLTGAVSAQLHLGFVVTGFLPALLGAIVIAIVGLAISAAIGSSRFATRLF